ncbi:MAG: DUF6273 domain-containing protein [Lachnospiraceae bacterium]
MKNKKMWIIAGIVLGILVIGIILALIFSQKKDDVYRLIKIESFTGGVFVERASTEEQVEVFEGQRLISKDEVTTEDASMVTLLVDNDKHIAAEENTQFSIRARGDEEDGKVSIQLEYGNALFEIENRLPDEQIFEVETPNAICSVRGTTFRVIYDSQTNITSVIVTDGVVSVEDKQREETIEVNAGESITVSDDGISIADYEEDNTNENNSAEDNTEGEAVSEVTGDENPEEEIAELIAPTNSLGQLDGDISSAQVGDVICYGTYESDYYDEILPLVWDVLYRDEEKILLVTHNVVDMAQYNSETTGTWETSDIRNELNTTYYNQFFTESEKAYILEAVISNPALDTFYSIYYPNGSGFDDSKSADTVDRLFLLSWEEIVVYYEVEKDVYGYPYFAHMGEVTNDAGEKVMWWIRSNILADTASCPVINDYNGMGLPLCTDTYGIRPAMYVTFTPNE